LNISETAPNRAIVTTERQYEVICTLSNGEISNNIDPNPDFKVTEFSESNISKTVHFMDNVTKEQ